MAREQLSDKQQQILEFIKRRILDNLQSAKSVKP